jgi:hypothetical protein
MITDYITFLKFVKWYMVSGFVFWEIEERQEAKGTAQEKPRRRGDPRHPRGFYGLKGSPPARHLLDSQMEKVSDSLDCILYRIRREPRVTFVRFDQEGAHAIR